ncbi:MULTISPECIES: hypothetical protein [Pseudomonas]|jgi:hypothetical protein|nr:MULTISPECIES: hypothetical protein [Pseudomonas]MBA4361660.1 hypothetical protein [Pseudomonas sp.]MDI1328828.1 hypothetical protein [Pseudomonas sp.]MDO8405241.1 hypothetical protein [Pseudomonas sp.]QQO01229.1 hypothetical protein JIO00_12005 [Pseudomonas sp. SW-3]
MNLQRARQLFNGQPVRETPTERLIHILEASIELVSMEENNFDWSSWEDAAAAEAELLGLVNLLKAGTLPERLKVAVLFAVTGPLQEVSLSSGWANTFLRLAGTFDEVEALLWDTADFS